MLPPINRYCKHGTYIGDPYGPDYICGACEDESGASLHEGPQTPDLYSEPSVQEIINPEAHDDQT